MVMNTESGRRREIVPSIPFLYIKEKSDWVRVITGTSWMGWGGRQFMTSDFTHDYKSRDSAVIINTSGYYEIIIETSLYLNDGTLDYLYISLYHAEPSSDIVNASFAEVDGTRSYLTPESDPNQVSIRHTMYLQKGSMIRGRTTLVNDSDPIEIKSKSYTDRFIIRWLPTRGWNNNAAGKINYRGGVMR